MKTAAGQRKRRIARWVWAVVLACSLASMPIAALADNDDEGSTDTAASASASAEATQTDSSQASASASGADLHGLYAAATETAFSNDATIETTAEGACGLYAEAGATIIANALTVQTTGSRAIAAMASAEGSAISIANSKLSTTNTDAPLLQSAGTVEADNVTGTAAKSQLARVKGAGSLMVDSSTLTSAATDAASDETMASAITLYDDESGDTTSTSSASAASASAASASTSSAEAATAAAASAANKTTLFQASDSKLESAIQSGAFFHLVNTEANIVLFKNDIMFDNAKAKLLVAAGSDTTSAIVSTAKNDTGEFGAAGKNGATATMTAIDQNLDGNIEVDSISALDFYLLEGSTWTGASSITANSAGSALATNIVVNVDATSGWIVTENSTVSRLNIEKGGMLVDEKGKAVTIVDADGNKLVDGASDIEVSVTDEFSTTVKASGVNAMRDATIDRASFDTEFGTSTAFGTNGAAPLSDEERAARLQAIITEWFENL